MKAVKGITVSNIIISALAWLVFLVNQVCKLQLFETGELWEATGYLFALLIGPFSFLVALVLAVVGCILVCRKSPKPSRRTTYLVINILCPAVTAIMLAGCYFGNALTWGSW